MTYESQAAVARATAAVFVDERRVGSAVLVGPQYLVTAAHVLRRQDPHTMAAVGQVELEFPDQGPGEQPGRTAAARIDLGPAGAGVDLAVLDLGEDRPGWLPAPVPVWPAARPPAKVQVFGYPLAEKLLNGVWRRFAVAGPATAGTLQLDWLGDAGTFPGHSGGPVIDAAGHALAGILVEGSERGRFDRFVPITLIARLWPQVPRPWLMTGGELGEARSHFTRRARGQRSAARGGDLFHGRTVALDRVGEWLTADEPPGQPLVLTGQPGAGKSAVLARAALSVEAGNGGPGLAFHARAATIGGFLAALADLTGIGTPASADELVTSLADLPGQFPVPVVLDALDEAASDRDRRQIAEALAELAVLPGLRVAVATRRLAAGNPYAPGALLTSLGVTADDDHNLVDLDSDTYFDRDDLRGFASALLAQDGMDRHTGAAWTQYRSHPAACDRMAAVIAERAGRNFLVAAMAAVPLSTARTMIDPAARGFDPADIPSRVGEALNKYLDHLPDHRRERVLGLLTALGYARGAGLDDPNWLAFAAALGYGASVADLDTLRRSQAADYLLQTTFAEGRARRVTRLWHEALTDELLAARYRSADESVLFDVLLGQAENVGWQDGYLHEHAAEHAVAGGRLDQLLGDPLYLTTVDPDRLVPYLDTARTATARAIATVYRQSAHHLTPLDRGMRASQLELTAHRLGCRDLAIRIADTAPDRPWQTCWSHGRTAIDHQVLTGHDGLVKAVAVGALPDGTPVIVSGGEDGTVRVWRLVDGTPVGDPITGHRGDVTAVAVGALPDGTPVIISGSDDHTVRVWRLADGIPARGPVRGHERAVTAVAVGALPDGTPVIVSGSDDHTVRVWRLADGTPVGKRLRGHDQDVRAVAVGALPDGTPVIVSGSDDHTVRVRRLATGTPVAGPLRGHERAVITVAVGALPDGTPVIVSGSDDHTVRVWRLADGIPVRGPVRGHERAVIAVAVGALPDGTPVIVSGGEDGTVRVWRLVDGTPVGDPIAGHHGDVLAVAVGALADGTPVIVSGSDDQTVRVWRLTGSTPIGMPVRGHDQDVNAVAVGALPDGTPVIVSGSDDHTVGVWRLADGTPAGKPLHGHTGAVTAVALGTLPDGTPVIVSGGGYGDGTVRIWRLADGTAVRKPLHGSGQVEAVTVGALADGTQVIVSGNHSGTVQLWRLADGAPARKPLHGYDRSLTAVATGALSDGTPVIVSGSDDGTVRVWWLADGIPVRKRLQVHAYAVSAVAVGALSDGTPVIVSGGEESDDEDDDDVTVRVWRLADGTPAKKSLHPYADWVTAVAVGALPDGTSVIVSGGEDGTVQVWRLADGTPLAPPLGLPERVSSVVVRGDAIVVAAGARVAVHKPTLLRPTR